MCRRVTCKQCGQPSWAGCGAHVESVLADVPRGERCRCREGGAPKQAAPKQAVAPTGPDTALGRLKAWLRK